MEAKILDAVNRLVEGDFKPSSLARLLHADGVLLHHMKEAKPLMGDDNRRAAWVLLNLNLFRIFLATGRKVTP